MTSRRIIVLTAAIKRPKAALRRFCAALADVVEETVVVGGREEKRYSERSGLKTLYDQVVPDWDSVESITTLLSAARSSVWVQRRGGVVDEIEES